MKPSFWGGRLLVLHWKTSFAIRNSSSLSLKRIRMWFRLYRLAWSVLGENGTVLFMVSKSRTIRNGLFCNISAGWHRKDGLSRYGFPNIRTCWIRLLMIINGFLSMTTLLWSKSISGMAECQKVRLLMSRLCVSLLVFRSTENYLGEPGAWMRTPIILKPGGSLMDCKRHAACSCNISLLLAWFITIRKRIRKISIRWCTGRKLLFPQNSCGRTRCRCRMGISSGKMAL